MRAPKRRAGAVVVVLTMCVGLNTNALTTNAVATETAAAGVGCPAPRPIAYERAPGVGKSVALTFDDGPGPTTATILGILERAKVRATFFNIGEQLADRAPALRREVRDGDALGNHTWSHANLLTLSPAAQQSQLDRTVAMQHRLTGTVPCLFRPPYEDFDASTLRVAASRHEATWLWSVDSEDWKAEGSDSAYWVHRIVARATAGVTQRHPVIIMHNMGGSIGSPATADALARIIVCYRSHGYRFVVLDDPGRADELIRRQQR